ncbi:MAG: rRNA maturation RNase YbeY [Flavobacteriales bacterium]|nr:rRNA maturation RNase YbeY [Flavobacteriales bacterium]
MSLSISFHSEDVDFQLENEQQILDWIKNTIQQEAKSATEISYIFCTDEYLYQMNLAYLNHDTYTDIITFDYTENSVVSGDIFISIDRVKENAIKFKTTFKNELSRVIIHGVLHLLGYKDKTPEQKQVMRSKEDFYLTLQSEIG